jgi:hypothetical protein
MSLEKLIEKGEWLDCYSDLLTKRQKECLELYYYENLTLAEIADYFHISRQAVHDAMRHGEEQLLMYEEALHLAEKRRKHKDAIERLRCELPEEIRERVESLLKILSD